MSLEETSAGLLAKHACQFDMDSQEQWAAASCLKADPVGITYLECAALPLALWPDSFLVSVRKLKRASWAKRQAREWGSDLSWMDEGPEKLVMRSAVEALAALSFEPRLATLISSARAELVLLGVPLDHALSKLKGSLCAVQNPRLVAKASLSSLVQACLEEDRFDQACTHALACIEKSAMAMVTFDAFLSDAEGSKRL